MRVWIAGVVVLWLASAGLANDSWVVGESGRVRRLKSEHNSVRMVREFVRMDVYPSHYDVDATFVFHNEGRATAVTMGFPEHGGGDVNGEHYRRETGFRRFATWVDGQRVRARRRVSAGVEDGYDAYWVKQVRFEKGQQRIVRVQYRSPASYDVTATHYASYDFTGGTWRGKVELSILRLVPHLPGFHFVSVSGGRRRGGEFVFRRRNWQAEGEVSLSYRSVPPGWMFVDDAEGVYDPSPDSQVLIQPGRAARFDWASPAIMRQGVVFLRLDALRGYLDEKSIGGGHSPDSALSWEAAKKEATLQVKGHRFSFRLSDRTMVVDGKALPLPAPPFLSPPAPDRAGQLVYVPALYVPAKPVLDVFGGTYAVSEAGHRLHIELPAAKGTDAAGGG